MEEKASLSNLALFARPRSQPPPPKTFCKLGTFAPAASWVRIPPKLPQTSWCGTAEWQGSLLAPAPRQTPRATQRGSSWLLQGSSQPGEPGLGPGLNPTSPPSIWKSQRAQQGALGNGARAPLPFRPLPSAHTLRAGGTLSQKGGWKKGLENAESGRLEGLCPPNTVSPAQDAHLREEGQAQAPSVQLDLFLQVIKPLLQL